MAAMDRQKFMFDEPFDEETIEREARAKKPAGPPLVYTEQDMAEATDRVRQEAETRAHAEGRAEGIEDVRESAEVHVAKALEALARTMPKLAEIQHVVAQAAQKEAIALGALIGRKLAGALLRRWPTDEIEEMIRDSLAELADVGQNLELVVRVSPDVAEELQPRMDELVQQTPSLARIAVFGDDTVTGTACRVEWADGGSERDPAAVEAEIEAAVERFLKQIEDLPEYIGDNHVVDAGPAESGADVGAAVERIAAGERPERTAAAARMAADSEAVANEPEDANPAADGDAPPPHEATAAPESGTNGDAEPDEEVQS